ncbi:hypothetical protein V1290_000010 [Bradyrhizobium sp. AZCC 1578]
MKALLIFAAAALFLALFGETIVGVAWWLIPTTPRL